MSAADSLDLSSRWLRAQAWRARMERLAARWGDLYLTVPGRTLGLFRLVYGLVLLVDLHGRFAGGALRLLFTDEGAVPVETMRASRVWPRAWSLFFYLHSVSEVRWGVAFCSLVFLLLALGFATKAMQLLTPVLLISLNNRNLFLQNGGVVVLHMLALLGIALPLGKHLSVDRVLAERKADRSATWSTCLRRTLVEQSPVQYRRWAYFAVLFSAATIYFFNWHNKQGDTWKSGWAVHWALWQNRVATQLAGVLRAHEVGWIIRLCSYSTMFMECLLPFLLLVPDDTRRARRVALCVILFLHTNFALLLNLGVFSYAMMALSLLLLSEKDWQLFDKRVGGRLPPEQLVVSDVPQGDANIGSVREHSSGPLGPASRLTGHVWAIFLMVCMTWHAVLSSTLTKGRPWLRRRPDWVPAAIDYLSIPQGWKMFAPNVPVEDGTLVVDALAGDGAHLDPFTGKAPDFDAPFHGPWLYSHSWCAYQNLVRQPKYAEFKPALRAYLIREGKSEPTDKHRRWDTFEVHWIKSHSPEPGDSIPYDIERRSVLTSEGETSGSRGEDSDP